MVPFSQFKFPWSGDIVQNIDPDIFFGGINAGAGDGEIEKEICCNKASYGHQLGLITDVLLTLVEVAKLDPNNHKALKELIDVHENIEIIKANYKANIQKNARRFLNKLKESDKEALEELLNEFNDQV